MNAPSDDPLIQDLVDAAGHVMHHALNGLPHKVLLAVGDAHTKGAEVELRVRAGDPAQITLWLVTDTDAKLIASVRN